MQAGTVIGIHSKRECICIYFAIFDGLFIGEADADDDDDSVMEFEMIFNEQN